MALASTNNNGAMSLEDKTKLNNIEAGAEINIIETVKVNNTSLTPDVNKAVNITVPTKTSDLTNDDNTVKDASYVHTDNNYATPEKNKLAGIETGAEVNAISSISVNGTAQTITNKNVNITVPTTTSQLTNNSDFTTKAYVDGLVGNINTTLETILGGGN